MDNCIEYKCKCTRACDLLNRCVFTHPLIEGDYFQVLELLNRIHGEKDKLRAILNFFHKKQPPKYPTKPLMLKGRRGMAKRFQKELGRRAMTQLNAGMERGRTMKELNEIKEAFHKIIQQTDNKL